MLEVTFASISTGASVDQQTGTLSVFDIIEEVRSPSIPFHLPTVVLALAFEKASPQTFSGQVLIHHISPDGTQKRMGLGNLIVPADKKRVKAVFRFGGFPVAGYGRHRVVVSWVDEGGQKQGEHVFDFDAIEVSLQGKPEPVPHDPITH